MEEPPAHLLRPPVGLSGHRGQGNTALSLTLVVPCYQEAAWLRPDRFFEFLDSSDATRLLFVDDGSQDVTLQVLTRMAAARPDRIAVLPLSQNVGKGEAVRRGLLRAMDDGCDLVGFWDADLAAPLRLVADFRTVLAGQPQVCWVFGSRWRALGRRIERTRVRHYLGRVFATAVSAVLRMPIYDSQCGAKVFRVDDLFRRVLEIPFTTRWVFDVEMLARLVQAHRLGVAPPPLASVTELPLTEWIDDRRSHVRPVDFLLSLGDLARIWSRYLRRNSR